LFLFFLFQKPEDVGYTVDEMAQMQAEYTEQPYSDLHDARKSAAVRLPFVSCPIQRFVLI